MKRVIVFALVLNAAVLGVLAHQMVAVAGGNQAVQNGDTNGDGSRDIGAPIYIYIYIHIKPKYSQKSIPRSYQQMLGLLVAQYT